MRSSRDADLPLAIGTPGVNKALPCVKDPHRAGSHATGIPREKQTLEWYGSKECGTDARKTVRIFPSREMLLRVVRHSTAIPLMQV
jgi:hypothetical protein